MHVYSCARWRLAAVTAGIAAGGRRRQLGTDVPIGAARHRSARGVAQP
jgi:hypothetical protein